MSCGFQSDLQDSARMRCELMNKPSKEITEDLRFVGVNQDNAVCRCKFGGIVLMSDEKVDERNGEAVR